MLESRYYYEFVDKHLTLSSKKFDYNLVDIYTSTIVSTHKFLVRDTVNIRVQISAFEIRMKTIAKRYNEDYALYTCEVRDYLSSTC